MNATTANPCRFDTICIFEDTKASQLNPLALTRPVYELRCGLSSLKEKLLKNFPTASVSLHCRDYLAATISEQNPGVLVNKINSDACLFFNGRVLINSALRNKIIGTDSECIYFCGDEIVAAFLKKEKSRKVELGRLLDFNSPTFSEVERIEVDAGFISYPWDLVNQNSAEIVSDFSFLAKGGEIHGQIHASVTLLNRQKIYIDTNSKIHPGVVLDAEFGPIYIGRNVTVMSNSVIAGPVYVGDNSVVKIGSKIYKGTSIGEMCKVGGEVAESIIHSFSNKQHDGFLGHAYLGQWVNLGAATNNSDLKNNYASVQVAINGEKVDSGSMFVGLFMGDHSKTAIHTSFNTGSVVGVMSNVFGPFFPPLFLSSFSWGGSESLKVHDFDRALGTAKRVMARRNVEMSAGDEAVLRKVYELTQHERLAF